MSLEGIIAQIINLTKRGKRGSIYGWCGNKSQLHVYSGWLSPPLMDTIKLNTNVSLEEGSKHAFGGGFYLRCFRQLESWLCN